MTNGQRHDRNRNGSTIHVDGTSQRNAHRIEIGVDLQTLAKRHVHGNVGGRTAGKEGIHGTFFQTYPHNRIRIGPQIKGNDERIHHERSKQHATHQEREQLAVVRKDIQPTLRHRAEHQSQYTQRSELNDPTYHGAHHFGQVAHHLDSLRAGLVLQREAHHNGPEQHTDIIGIDHTLNRIAHHVVHHLGKHIRQAARSTALGRFTESHLHRKYITRHDGHHRCHQSSGQIKKDHSAKPGTQSTTRLRNGAGHQNSH